MSRRRTRRKVSSTRTIEGFCAATGRRKRNAVARLHALGFRPPPRFWSEGDAPDFELSERHLPRAVRALLSEGWRVEAENLRYRAPGRTSLRVASGVDWFEVQGEVDFEGQVVPLPALLRALRDGSGLRGLGGRDLRPPSRGVAQASRAPRGARGGSSRRGCASRLRRSRSSMPCWRTCRRSTWDATFARARERLAEFDRHRTPGPGAGVPRHAARRTSARAWAGFSSCSEFGFGGCLADDMGLGKTVQVLALLEPEPGSAGDRRPSLVVVPRSLVFNWKEEAARFAPDLQVLDHTGLDRPRSPADLAGRRPGAHDLRHAAPRRRAARRHRVRLRRSSTRRRRSRTPRSQAAKAARLLRARPPPGALRHADREPPRRAVEPVRVPEPRHARRVRRLPAAAEALRDPDDEARAARWRGRCARSSCGAPRTRSRRTCPRRPSRRSAASSVRSSASSTTSCATTTARRCSARIERARDRQVEDPRARGAAAPAPGRLPPRPARPEARRRAERQARRAAAAARRGRSRKATRRSSSRSSRASSRSCASGSTREGDHLRVPRRPDTRDRAGARRALPGRPRLPASS